MAKNDRNPNSQQEQLKGNAAVDKQVDESANNTKAPEVDVPDSNPDNLESSDKGVVKGESDAESTQNETKSEETPPEVETAKTSAGSVEEDDLLDDEYLSDEEDEKSTYLPNPKYKGKVLRCAMSFRPDSSNGGEDIVVEEGGEVPDGYDCPEVFLQDKPATKK